MVCPSDSDEDDENINRDEEVQIPEENSRPNVPPQKEKISKETPTSIKCSDLVLGGSKRVHESPNPNKEQHKKNILDCGEDGL